MDPCVKNVIATRHGVDVKTKVSLKTHKKNSYAV